MLNAVVVSIHSSRSLRSETGRLGECGLRQQLAVFKRNIPRPKLNNRDRLFWIGLYMIWQDWKSALMVVQPETVTSWHRKRFRRYWWKLSQPKQPGRPRIRSEIRKLVHTMASANPNLGSATGTRGTEKTGIRDFRTDGVAAHAKEEGKAIAE